MLNTNKIDINISLVRRLIDTQFPQWTNLPIKPVECGGWDNRTFHLGEHMLIRMPSAIDYGTQVEKEHLWLPKLAPLLPLPIPTPLAIGKPTDDYPLRWSIYRWLEGDTATTGHINNLCDFAASLAHFLISLQSIDSTSGPTPGPHSFYRGGTLTTYDSETRQAITNLKNKIDIKAVTQVWEAALAATWHGSPVWVHGDISAGNLLVQKGRLSAVIDFGQLTVGDPACDLAITWTFFHGESRDAFRAALPLDNAAWARGRGWALWKALIICAALPGTNSLEAEKSRHVIDEVLEEHKR